MELHASGLHGSRALDSRAAPGFLQACQQSRKFWCALLTFSLGGSMVLAQSALQGLLGQGFALGVALLATFTSLAALGWLAVALRCPACGLRLLWRAVTNERATEWLIWLLSLSRCPLCHFRPRSTSPSA